MKELQCSKDFSHYKSMGIFPDAQGQLTLQMDVLVTCKYEEDPIKNKGARVDTTLYINFSYRADNSGVGVGIWPKFELIQAFMHVLVTCKNEDD